MRTYKTLSDMLDANPDLLEVLGDSAVICFGQDGSVTLVPATRGKTTIPRPECFLKMATTSPDGTDGTFVGTPNKAAKDFVMAIPVMPEYFKAWRFGAAVGEVVNMAGKVSVIPSTGVVEMRDDGMQPLAVNVKSSGPNEVTIIVEDDFALEASEQTDEGDDATQPNSPAGATA